MQKGRFLKKVLKDIRCERFKQAQGKFAKNLPYRSKIFQTHTEKCRQLASMYGNFEINFPKFIQFVSSPLILRCRQKIKDQVNDFKTKHGRKLKRDHLNNIRKSHDHVCHFHMNQEKCRQTAGEPFTLERKVMQKKNSSYF